MSIDDLIFIDNLPKIDLHSLDREISRVLINDFIKDNIKLKHQFIVIIHGNGSGILKRTTSEVLKRNKNVIEYKTFYNIQAVRLQKSKFDKKNILC